MCMYCSINSVSGLLFGACDGVYYAVLVSSSIREF